VCVCVCVIGVLVLLLRVAYNLCALQCEKMQLLPACVCVLLE
jgi:hypothetical protein